MYGFDTMPVAITTTARGQLGTALRSNTPLAISALYGFDVSACADRKIEPARVLVQVVEEVLA